MTTSGVTAWSLTARDIITQAMRENAILSSGEDPTDEELVDCMVRLNAILKSWGAKASNLWREATGTVTIPANDPSGMIDADIREITSARVIVSGTYHRQMGEWERDDYFSLPNKTASGSPTIFYLSKGVGQPTMHVWPVPTVETTIAIDYLRAPETVTSASETLDFPEEYQEALYANLALRCCGLFGVPPQPELVERARQLERELLDASRPAAYYLRGACG